MKTFIVEVDLIGTCGDTLLYIVKEESAILAKEKVKKDVLSEEAFTIKFQQESYISALYRDDMIKEYSNIQENTPEEYKEEYIEEYLNAIVCRYDINDTIHTFTRKDILDNFDEVKKVVMEAARIQSYEYAVDFAKITEIPEESGIYYGVSIYHGC
jgi:hypothetical protein